MEDFYNISQDENYTYSNITFNYNSYYGQVDLNYVMTWIIICIGLPLTLVAIFAVCSLVRNDHVAPIYVINLLISDLIQLCCLIIWVSQPEEWRIYVAIYFTYNAGLVASVCFMVCVALERYLLIAYPVWYRFRRSIKASVVVCVVVWVLPLVYLLTSPFWNIHEVAVTIYLVFFLLPLPLLTFFLGGTLKALSAYTLFPSDKKRRIVGMLVMVLLIYTLLFLPSLILLVSGGRYDNTFNSMSSLLLRMSPLADSVLYVFMRKGVIDKFLASVCCCRVDSNDVSSPAV